MADFIKKGWNPPTPSDEQAGAILGDMRGTRRNSTLHLSPRERQVIYLLAEGQRDREIASELGIGYESVRTYKKKLRGKLGARTTAQAVAIWVKSTEEEQ